MKKFLLLAFIINIILMGCSPEKTVVSTSSNKTPPTDKQYILSKIKTAQNAVTDEDGTVYNEAMKELISISKDLMYSNYNRLLAEYFVFHCESMLIINRLSEHDPDIMSKYKKIESGFIKMSTTAILYTDNENDMAYFVSEMKDFCSYLHYIRKEVIGE